MPRKSKNEALSDAEYRALAEFRYALRRFLAFSKSAAESAGLTPRQHQALLTIKGYPGRSRATVGELAERLQVRHHSAVGLVDRLTELGLVVRRAGTRDRRETYVELTRRGEAKLRRLTVAHRREIGKMAPVFRTLVARINDGG